MVNAGEILYNEEAGDGAGGENIDDLASGTRRHKEQKIFLGRTLLCQ